MPGPQNVLAHNRFAHIAAADYAGEHRGVEAVANLVAAEGIDCDLRRRPAYTYAIEESERDAVATEAEAARQSGLAVVYDPGGDLDVPFPVYGSVRLDDQLAIHPVRYLHGLAAAVDGDGSRVFEHSRALGVRDGTPVQVRTEDGAVSAERVVIATHAPLLDRAGYFARMEAIRAYCVAARCAPETHPSGWPSARRPGMVRGGARPLVRRSTDGNGAHVDMLITRIGHEKGLSRLCPFAGPGEGCGAGRVDVEGGVDAGGLEWSQGYP